MLFSLPVFVFIITFLGALALNQELDPLNQDWRKAFLQAALVWGALLLLISEGLSLFTALSPLGISTAWSVVLFAFIVTGWKSGLLAKGWKIIIQRKVKSGWFDGLITAGLSTILLILVIVALISPPNNTDSLLYHMSRVVHWAQNHSIRHYPTGNESQLWNPIWAELAILQLRALWGNDRLANLVQWFSLFGSLIGVSALAKLLGAGQKGQLAAAVFAVSIPMGILQATSTQNDHVVAFWLVCLAYFTLLSAKRELNLFEWLSWGLALGLGLLTKGTFYPYALPFVLWHFTNQLIKRRRFISQGFGTAAIILVLNLGYWTRNFLTYSTPLGSQWWIQDRTANHIAISSLIGALLKNTFLNFATPYERTNALMTAYLGAALRRINQPLDKFELTWGWNHEDLAGNPIHVILVVITAVLLLLYIRKLRDRLLLSYALVVSATYIMLALVVTHDPYVLRLQLPFLISWAPVFGTLLTIVGAKRLLPIVMTILLLCALPWVLINRSRPIISMRSQPEPLTIPCTWQLSCTIGSILRENPSTVLFANFIHLRDSYLQMSRAIQSTDCKDIGLRIDSHDPEYIFWWLLDAPQSGFRLESIYSYSHLDKYADPNFKPCLILCTVCGERTRLHGLDLVGTYANAKLFMGTQYIPNPDG